MVFSLFVAKKLLHQIANTPSRAYPFGYLAGKAYPSFQFLPDYFLSGIDLLLPHLDVLRTTYLLQGRPSTLEVVLCDGTGRHAHRAP